MFSKDAHTHWGVTTLLRQRADGWVAFAMPKLSNSSNSAKSCVLVNVCRCVCSRLMFHSVCINTLSLSGPAASPCHFHEFKTAFFLEKRHPLPLFPLASVGANRRISTGGRVTGSSSRNWIHTVKHIRPFRGTNPSSGLEFSHHSAPSVDICTSHRSQCCHQAARGTCLNGRMWAEHLKQNKNLSRILDEKGKSG